MKKASEEIRTLVVNAYLSGSASRRQLSEIFGYTPASISNWVREYKREKRLAPRPQGHGKAAFAEVESLQLSELLKKRVDLTLAEIKEHFHKQCSLVAVHDTVAKLGLVFKKRRGPANEGARTSPFHASNGASFERESSQADWFFLMNRVSKPT
jgi:transposase